MASVLEKSCLYSSNKLREKENNFKILQKMSNNESVAKYYVCRRMKQKGPN
jgi:hypothetical protein